MTINKNILLISLQVDLAIIGLKHIHYYLLEHNYKSHFLVLPNFDPKNLRAIENLREFVSKINPIFIGISLMSTEYAGSRDVSLYLKNKFPTTPIVWGGIHPTIAPETCFPFADYVCLGEGEKSLKDFANAVISGQDPRQIRNLCYKENDQLRRNPVYPLIENLDELPLCDHIPKNSFLQESDGNISEIDTRILKKYGRYQGRFYDLVTSLGCQLSCTFCCSNLLSRLYGIKKIRKRSVENIIIELENAVRDYPFIEMINFQDENFLSYSPEFIKNFRDEYISRVNLPFMFACIPMYITREKIALLKEAGLTWIRMGLQSGSDRICREVYKRKSLPKHFLEGASILKEFGVSAYCDVIVDNPFETDEDQLDTVKVLMKAPKPYYLQLYSLSPYYGTELYEKIMKECPEKMPDSTKKDYHYCDKTALNDLTRLAPYLPEKPMTKLVQLYEKNPGGIPFRAILSVAKILGALLFEPIAYFRALKLSQGDSYKKLLRAIPVYINMLLIRYEKRFHYYRKTE